MKKYHVELTNAEADLFKKIDFQLGGSHPDAHAAFLANQAPLLALLKSLSERNGVPAPRIRYWDDPSYQNGRLRGSHKELFERAGNRGEEIYTHPNFLPYLRYFLFGADLPDVVVASFEEKVGNPKWVTSGDIVPIGKHARQLIREYQLGYGAAEEFFKLCLDMGLSRSIASLVRESAKRAR